MIKYKHYNEAPMTLKCTANLHGISCVQNIIGKNGRMFCVVKYGSWMCLEEIFPLLCC
ncbi:unnamed protein product, partial [Vitis vinifera]|uniref:Uncharacterized protein n=1 Tax=Vitis vinifera TaxID=29760 RepID=D7TZA2_VITVI